MAVVNNSRQVMSGAITNTLGTLGRSVFNSTIGSISDKDTMDQIYGVMNKLSSAIETVDKTIDVDALTGRNKADDLFALLASMDIKSSSDFMNKNSEFRKRLMRLNKQEKDITLDAIGVDVTGESNVVKNEYIREYPYTEGNNYYEDYAKTLSEHQRAGDETTTLQLESSTNFNYAGNHNDLYVVNQNLYPDDENKGSFSNKWIVENRNSLLYKTKKLFNSKKVNTIISRFHTNPSRPTSLLDNAKTKYGLSHGRNLLTAKAENSLTDTYINGYDNPYCRVWTHHHQYDRYYKTIRPFSHIDDRGNYVDTMSVQDFHTWSQFSDTNDTNRETKGDWGWKKEANNGWQYSVLQDNGKVNITPKYINGGSSNIHTKQCMFSIENLAWRGYDPYSFEQALSWEQRGPLGGRIMWFPPYGIEFNETTTTQWANTTFLGRGEDVYTYTNTTRTGTLTFMMVVDHPSILDYVSWTNQNKNVSDTDILRFLAGCGEGDGKGLRDLAKPTPLTDEFTQVHDVETNLEEEKVIIPPDPIEAEVVVKMTNESKPKEKPKNPKSFAFFVYYPNNYSGTYDDPEGEGWKWCKESDHSKVEAIPYLLYGKGAQKIKGDINFTNNTSHFENDLEFNEKTGYANHGNGYEMRKNDKEGLGKDNYIIGEGGHMINNKVVNNAHWAIQDSSKKSNGVYHKSSAKKWYYRIDGRYSYPADDKTNNKDIGDEKLTNYYCQTLGAPSQYIDGISFGFNSDVQEILKYRDDVIKDENETGYNKYLYKDGSNNIELFSLAEVAFVLYEGKSFAKQNLRNNLNQSDADERIKRLKKILEKKDLIEQVTGEGWASAHGYIPENQMLAHHRGQTASNWFLRELKAPSKNHGPIKQVIDTKQLTKTQMNVKGIRDGDSNIGTRIVGKHDAPGSKSDRCALVKVYFKSVETKSSAEIASEVKSGAAAKPNATESQSTTDSQGGSANTEGASAKKSMAMPSEMLYRDGGQGGSGEGGTTTKDQEQRELDQNLANNIGGKNFVGYRRTGQQGWCEEVQKYCDIYVGENGKKWYYIEGNPPKFISVEYAAEYEREPIERYGTSGGDENRLRYDQEYHFFKVLKETDPVVFNSLMDKLQYFDPAFHSMTPEGFNGRLTFLQQCMRQGNTVSASDGKFTKTANNLAFGRAPYCVLRLGDFYNQMIVIDSLAINYDPLVWDLNVEGIGVQPLLAKVTLNFKFVGGGDLTGPVRRLQNAMSFNYYANARLYDNRADRVERMWSDKTNGAIEHDEIINVQESKKDQYYGKDKKGNLKDVSKFYTTRMYK